MSDKINEMPDGFYYFCELRIPKSTDFDIEAVASEFVNNCPDGFAPFWKQTFSEDDYYCIELWKIVGDWLSPAVANTLSLWQIEDICAERNLAYVPRKENESSLWKRWGIIKWTK